MRQLLEGISRFQNRVFGHYRKRFEKLAQGQSPIALFITCSDSRVVPDLFTQSGPGDLFVLRNAGNIVPPYATSNGGEAPTIEYAVSALAVRDIIVCGHSGCGAMQALLDPPSAPQLTTFAAWLEHAEATCRMIRNRQAVLSGQALLDCAIEENVLVQVENLKTHPAVRDGVTRGALGLHAWVYRFETGAVLCYSAEQRKFVPIVEAASASVRAASVSKSHATTDDKKPVEIRPRI